MIVSEEYCIPKQVLKDEMTEGEWSMGLHENITRDMTHPCNAGIV